VLSRLAIPPLRVIGVAESLLGLRDGFLDSCRRWVGCEQRLEDLACCRKPVAGVQTASQIVASVRFRGRELASFAQWGLGRVDVILQSQRDTQGLPAGRPFWSESRDLLEMLLRLLVVALFEGAAPGCIFFPGRR